MTSVLCRIGIHSWSGCRCRRKGCSETRDAEHDWNGCKCTHCYRRRHVYELGACKYCGKRSPELTALEEKLGNLQAQLWGLERDPSWEGFEGCIDAGSYGGPISVPTRDELRTEISTVQQEIEAITK